MIFQYLPSLVTLSAGVQYFLSFVALCCNDYMSFKDIVYAIKLDLFQYDNGFQVSVEIILLKITIRWKFAVYDCSICACLGLSVSSSSWCLGRAAVCDCGTPWTFLLPFLSFLNLNIVYYYFLWLFCFVLLIKEKSNVCKELQLKGQTITKTCLYNSDTLKPHFYIVKLGFTGVYIIFLFLL